MEYIHCKSAYLGSVFQSISFTVTDLKWQNEPFKKETYSDVKTGVLRFLPLVLHDIAISPIILALATFMSFYLITK